MNKLAAILIVLAILFIAACWNVLAVADWLVRSPIVSAANRPACWTILGLIVLLAVIWAAARKGKRSIDMDAAEDARRQIERQW